jgi:tetrahydromethanopterin S-methyltransferase subunit G
MEDPMDDRERIAKLESTVDAHCQQFDRIEHRFDRLEDRMERGFAELRGDIAKLTRWMVGMFVTYGIAIVGLLIKVGFGS